ncbi:MAG: VPLPA-CTERM-specific exosortase XrtD [Gammaproteobacteria bacterium]
MSTCDQDAIIWKQTPWMWSILVVSFLLMVAIFNEGLMNLVAVWGSREEYSYGYLVPFVVAFLIWQKKEDLQRIKFEGSWSGVVVVIAGLLLYMLGELSALYVVVQYSFLVVLTGLILSLVGWRAFKKIWVPLLILAFMIPLPNFILRTLSAELQLISSQIGVWVIKAFGISVLLEGNVIDLGEYKLQVVEACSGLRYLFPLMTFGFITAYFYKSELWKRMLIFLSTIPITVLMNSIRIGIIGVTVEYWGQSMAEGFLHDFEGWVIFMTCTGVLFLEMWLLARVGKQKRSLGSVFAIELPRKSAPGNVPVSRSLPSSYIGVALLLAFMTTAALLMPEREEIQPPRKQFALFPLVIDGWQGKDERLEKIYVDALKFDDYIMADYRDSRQREVNFYVAYYGSQRKGESAHSPRSCIPGGGWQIESLTQRSIDGVKVNNYPLQVNRTVIAKGQDRQLVYYWFQQRGRVITNEYMVKWYLFWDALTKNRTDGALVRLTAYVTPEQDISEVDALMTDFLRSVTPLMDQYIPT